MSFVRAVLTAVVEGVVKRWSGTGRAGETFTGRELFQHYGFTSRALAGAEAIVVQRGAALVVIAEDDRRFRLAIEAGEVCLNDDLGSQVYLKRGGEVALVAPSKVTVTAPEVVVTASTSVTVTSPTVTVTASTSVTFTTPLVAITGALTVGGTAVTTGALSSLTSVADPTGTIDEMREIYDAHTHGENGDGGGTTDPPNQPMGGTP